MWGKNEGACVPRWRGETRRGRLRAEGRRRSMDIAVGRPMGAAMIRPVRHRFASKAWAWPRKVRVSGRRGGRRSMDIAFGCRRMPQRSSKCAIALWEARAQAERPPLWGSDDVSAMRNYRYRHRDSPYVAKRSGERTSRAGRPWAVGGELPGARWRGRPVCARCDRPRKGQRRHKCARVGFFHPHPTLGCGAQGAGGAERRTDQFSVRLF